MLNVERQRASTTKSNHTGNDSLVYYSNHHHNFLGILKGWLETDTPKTNLGCLPNNTSHVPVKTHAGVSTVV